MSKTTQTTKPKSRTQLKKELQAVINELMTTPCSFWACPGPNKPAENMATCKICWAVKDLRKIKKEL